MAHINSQLKEVYNNYWHGLICAATSLNESTPKPANPLLISIDEAAYEKSGLKIMYCGQETYGWSGTLGCETVDQVLSTYEAYFTEGGYKPEEEGKRAFWRAVKRFNAAIQLAFTGQRIYPIWNNISKIGIANKKGMHASIRELEQRHFPVFKEELALLQPDLVIFMTGPNRDGDICFNLQKSDFYAVSGEIKKRALARVVSPNLTGSAIRLYHPAYFGGFNRVSDAAIGEMIKLLSDTTLLGNK